MGKIFFCEKLFFFTVVWSTSIIYSEVYYQCYLHIFNLWNTTFDVIQRNSWLSILYLKTITKYIHLHNNWANYDKSLTCQSAIVFFIMPINLVRKY